MGKVVEGSPAVGPLLGVRTSRFTSRFFVCYRIMYPAGGRVRHGTGSKYSMDNTLTMARSANGEHITKPPPHCLELPIVVPRPRRGTLFGNRQRNG